MGDPARLADWRIAVSLHWPHPDLLFSDLTPEQAFELRAYHAMEPFGEVRADFRMANLISSNLQLHVKKGTKSPPLASFTLYKDIAERAEERRGTEDLANELAQFAEKSSG